MDNLANYLHKRFNFDAHYFLKGGLWMTFGQIFTIVFGLISTVLFAHYLSENDYGIYRYLIGIAGLLSAFSLTGLSQSILQTSAKGFPGFYKQTLKTNFFYSLGITIVGLIGFLYYFLNDNDTLAIGCLMVAILQPVINTYQYLPAYLQGTGQFALTTKIHLLRMVFVTSASVLTLFISGNIIVLFLTYLLSTALINVTTQIFYKPDTTLLPEETFNKYLKYAKHTSLRNVLSNVAQRLDSIVIFTYLGAAQLAAYSIAILIPEQIKASVKNLATLLLPKYVKNLESYSTAILYKRSLQLFFILLVVTIMYILAAPFLYEILFPKYPAAVLYTQLAALSIPTYIMLLPSNYLQAQLNEKALYRLTIYGSLIQMATLIILTVLYGVIGAIISKLIHRLILTVITFYLTKKYELT